MPSRSTLKAPLIEVTYVGPRYGAAPKSGNEAIRRMARCEGVVLDPVYTGLFALSEDSIEGASITKEGI